jgi:hypothetical protein
MDIKNSGVLKSAFFTHFKSSYISTFGADLRIGKAGNYL